MSGINWIETPHTNILITGVPGIGKTTVIRKLCADLRHLNPVGFYTQEIREQGVRKGFDLVSLDGRKSILSHVDIQSHHRVGKYGVDVAGFERFLDTIDLFDPLYDLIVIDEIGKMECLSDKFRRLLVLLLDSDSQLVATIALKGGGVIDQTKNRADVRLLPVTPKSRDGLPVRIAEMLAGE